ASRGAPPNTPLPKAVSSACSPPPKAANAPTTCPTWLPCASAYASTSAAPASATSRPLYTSTPENPCRCPNVSTWRTLCSWQQSKAKTPSSTPCTRQYSTPCTCPTWGGAPAHPPARSTWACTAENRLNKCWQK